MIAAWRPSCQVELGEGELLLVKDDSAWYQVNLAVYVGLLVLVVARAHEGRTGMLPIRPSLVIGEIFIVAKRRRQRTPSMAKCLFFFVWLLSFNSDGFALFYLGLLLLFGHVDL